MKTVADVIDALGGHSRLAAAIGVPPGTVSAWKSRGSIPARQWIRLVAEARQARLETVTLESLAAIHGGKGLERPSVEHRDDPPKPRSRRKIRVRLELDAELLAEAKRLELDLETLADEAIRDRVQSEKTKHWQAEHADVIDWYNEHIERDGIFGEEWRTF